MTISKIRELLSAQEYLSTGIEQLAPVQLENFLSQLMKYGADLGSKQRQLLLAPFKSVVDEVPLRDYQKSGNKEDQQIGKTMLLQGKTACLILAGGQGTRLGVDGPKGIVPVSPIKGKSLFQIFCERTKAASDWSGRQLPLCIMTSPLNHKQTVDFFQTNHYFGLPSSQISFFEQGMLPFIDDRGQWLLEEPGKIAEGPDGNGDALRLFFESGLWEQYQAQGIEYLNIIVVDNVLADPFDVELFGFAKRTGADVALKAVERLASDEKMGVIAERDGRLKLIEYSELPSNSTQFTLSNIGLFCISMEFIHHLYRDLKIESPLHLARKSAKVLLGTAKGYTQEKVSLWKCEKFIFDIFDHARSSKVLVCPREKTYAPLKNASGDKSVETVKQALYLHYRELYRAITGLLPSVPEFELDPAFYYPSLEMTEALAKLPLSDKTYVDAKVEL